MAPCMLIFVFYQMMSSGSGARDTEIRWPRIRFYVRGVHGSHRHESSFWAQVGFVRNSCLDYWRAKTRMAIEPGYFRAGSGMGVNSCLRWMLSRKRRLFSDEA